MIHFDFVSWFIFKHKVSVNQFKYYWSLHFQTEEISLHLMSDSWLQNQFYWSQLSPFSWLFFLLQILTCEFSFTERVKTKLDKSLMFLGWKDRVDIFLEKVWDMGLFYAYIWHNTPLVCDFSPPEWEKILWCIYPGLKRLFSMIMWRRIRINCQLTGNNNWSPCDCRRDDGFQAKYIENRQMRWFPDFMNSNPNCLKKFTRRWCGKFKSITPWDSAFSFVILDLNK